MWLGLILLGILGLLLYQIFKPREGFWKQYGIQQVESSSIYDVLQVFIGKKTVADNDDIIYKKMGSSKFCGVVEMGQPILFIKDLAVLKKVFIKDFDHFVDRTMFSGGDKQTSINKMLANLRGDEWKGVRASVSPAFTTGRIRRMMGYFNSVANNWVNNFKGKTKQSGRNTIDVNIEKETIYFTVDVIASAVFGMEAGTIANPDSLFARMAKRISHVNILSIIKFGLSVSFPEVIKFFGISVVDPVGLSFFENVLSQGLKSRLEGNAKLNDYIQLVVEARKGELKVDDNELSTFEKEAQIHNSSNEKKNYLNDDDIVIAQAVGFFFAGFSTTSNIIGFLLYMLALHQDVQSKLREEINGNSRLFSKESERDIDYDELNQLVYLDMFVCETLRKYPPLLRLDRKCTKDYYDPVENIRVPKGAVAGIPVQSIRNDKRYYDHPDSFYPEHFTAENKAKRSPYAYLPFGIGPRNCIGMRFALVESKAAVVHLVRHFMIEPSAKTPIPPKPKSIGLGVQLPTDLELKLTLIE